MPFTRSRAATALLLGLAASLAPVSARAQSRTARDYVLVARDGITISQSQIVAGDVAVLDGDLSSPRSFTAPLSTLAAASVHLGEEAVCRGIRAASTRGGGLGCREAGAFVQPFAVPEDVCGFPVPFPACDRQATRVVVPRGATLALPSGSYSDVLVEGGAGRSGRLRLSGAYSFCSLRLSRDATVDFTGPTTLHVDGSLTSGNDTTFAPQPGVAADQVRVFVNGRLVRFNREASVGALICAPGATIRITNGVTLRGQVVGDSMRIRRSTLTIETGDATTTTTTTTIGTTTTTLPPAGACGDGTVDPGEVCDGDVLCTSAGGSFLDCSACGSFTSGPCTPPTAGRCGDGTRDLDEECDDGNTAACDGCSARCTVERVGNGVVDCDEECDDGNTRECDGCDATGSLECGDDVIDAACGEVCDGANVGGQTCAGGAIVCAADCRSVDRSQCPADSPAPAEVCGNCLDDDLDGLVDYEDPACCSSPTLGGATLKKLRLKARTGGGTTIRLRANLGPNASRVAPARDRLVLQARTASGAPLLCAQVPGLRATRKAFRFRDPAHRVATAQPLDVVRLRATKRGQLRLMARGKRTRLPVPAAGSVQVTVAAIDPATGDARCARMQAALRPGRRGVMRAP